jgi:hypothetical protein
MNIKAVALNHMVEDQTSFFRPKGIQFDCVSNRLGARSDRGYCRPSAGAWIKNASSTSFSTKRQEPPNSHCFILRQWIVPELLPRNSSHGEISFRCRTIHVI